MGSSGRDQWARKQSNGNQGAFIGILSAPTAFFLSFPIYLLDGLLQKAFTTFKTSTNVTISSGPPQDLNISQFFRKNTFFTEGKHIYPTCFFQS